jgi:AAA family ATP:ADP antiporter
MKDRLFQLPGVEHGEEPMVLMLLTQSVFIGIFFGAFDISANSLFLGIFDEKAMARAWVVSGFTGVILTGLYTLLETRLRFKNFASTNLIFVTVLTLILWIALMLSPSKWVIFCVFIMMGPLNTLAILGFRGTTGRLFSIAQGKRLSGLAGTGLIIGIILSCYSIPLLLAINLQLHNILFISAGSILIAAVIQILIGNRFTFASEKSEQLEKKKTRLSIFREDSYIRIMGIFIAFSVVTAFFVQYSFMAVTREQYPAEEDMARFLGLFTGSMMIFTLLIRILAFSYLIRNFGLRTCLAISPLLVAGSTAIAVIIGSLLGYTPVSGGFLLFFLLLALSRLFSKSLKDSIEAPSFKIIYQTIDEKIRYKVQSAIDVTINEIAVLASGLLLAGLGALSFVKLIHFSWVLFGMIIIWSFFARRLYIEYRKSIRKSLEAVTSGKKASTKTGSLNSLKNRASGAIQFKLEYYKIINGDYSTIDHSVNKWYLDNIIGHARRRQDLNLLPVLKKITGKQDLDEVLRYESAEIIDQIEITNGDYRKLDNPVQIPAEDEKIINARRILAGQRLPQTTEILRLLRDNNPESKRHAIYMIGKFRLKDMLSEVCECLSIQGLEADASMVIENFGTESSGELQRFYLSSSGNLNTSKTILRLLGKSGTRENTIFMFARLRSNSRQLKDVVLKCLSDCGYKADNEDRDKLNQFISEIIGIITWYISAQISLVQNNDEVLLEVIKKETNAWNSFLFNLLSIAYDAGSLAKIRANIESGTVAGVNYAIEIIDLVIDDSIKAKLVSLIDAVSDEEKLKNLQQFYPGEVPHYNDLIEDILNRDYNLISIWTKAFTLRHMTSIAGENAKESVVALLFSPEKILHEEAAHLIGRTNKNLFYEVINRIPDGSGSRIGKIVSEDFHAAEYLFEKVKFLSVLFKDIPEDELIFLAGLMGYYNATDFVAMKEIPDSILWNLLADFSVAGVFTIFESNLAQYIENHILSADSFFYVLSLQAMEDYRNQYPENSYELFKYLDEQENNYFGLRTSDL